MTKFVKFTNPIMPNNSIPIYVNPKQVSMIRADNEGVHIILPGVGNKVLVQYDLDEVIRMLSE